MIVPPVIVSESGDVDVFGSVGDAERYLEPIDVQAGRFIAFDSEGRLLKLHPTIPRVTIDCAEETPTHEEQLSDLLRRFLGHVGVTDPGLASESLAKLVERSLAFKVR
jgi:hypothetical protein